VQLEAELLAGASSGRVNAFIRQLMPHVRRACSAMVTGTVDRKALRREVLALSDWLFELRFECLVPTETAGVVHQ